MIEFNGVVNAHILLPGLLSMMSSRILLEGALPRNRHGQRHGIQWRVVKTFTDQAASRQQAP